MTPEDLRLAVMTVGFVLGLPTVLLVLLTTDDLFSSVAWMLGIVGGPYGVWIAVSKANTAKQTRQTKHWQAEDAALVRSEKIEAIGHTIGGLSDPMAGEAGGLSEAMGGELSEVL